MLRKISSAALFVIVCTLTISFTTKKDPSTFDLKIKFVHSDLVLDKGSYANTFAQSFSISKLQYYISNLQLLGDSTEYLNRNGYYLIDASNDSTCTIILKNVPEKKYNSLLFIIGIDSLKSTEESVQEGSLDPMNGMFWTWNTGYIFFKLEGKFSNKDLTYHIGGYKKPANCIRRVKLDILSQSKEIIIQVEARKFLQDIDLSKLPTVTSHLHAEEMANKYQELFSIKN